MDVTTPPQRIDRPSAHALHDAVLVARRRLLDVLYARARTLSSVTSWTGPARARYDEDAADLLAAGRALDASLATLLAAIEAELATTA